MERDISLWRPVSLLQNFPKCWRLETVKLKEPTIPLIKMSFISMKINLQVRLSVIRMVSHENWFSHWGRENSEMVYFVRKREKNEQLCQKSWNWSLVTPACNYAVAMATLKVVDTQLNIKTYPLLKISTLPFPQPFEGLNNTISWSFLVGNKITNGNFKLTLSRQNMVFRW